MHRSSFKLIAPEAAFYKAKSEPSTLLFAVHDGPTNRVEYLY